MNPPLIFAAVFSIIVASTLSPLAAVASPFAASTASEATVVISEIYANSALTPERGDSAEHEFIELHNRSDQPQSLAGMALTRDDDLEVAGNNGEMYFEDGELAAGEHHVIHTLFPLPNGGTTLELYYPGESGLVLQQQVTYPEADEASSLQLYDSEWDIALPTPGEPTKSPIEDDGAIIDSPETTPPQDGEQPEDEVTLPPCSISGVVISEIVANPSGSDSDGGEFVELHNQNASPVSLIGCTLSTDKIDTYVFDTSDTIVSGGYLSLPLYDELLNAGGSVMLATADHEEVVVYPELSDDEAYALIDDGWKLTRKQTPGEPNALPNPLENATSGLGILLPCPTGKFRNPATNRCKTAESSTGLASCSSDQYRNPLTNRCKKKLNLSSELETCDEGQFRNPATNRCKKIDSASVTLKVCGADQFRNPATNRCKKVAGETGLKPCEEGSKRHPETNRCRKETVISGATSSSEDSGTGGIGTTVNGHNVALVVIAASFLTFFLLYEYRLSLRTWFTKVRPSQLSQS